MFAVTTTTRRTAKRSAQRRRKRKRRLWPLVLVFVLLVGIVGIGFALSGGYDVYIHSTFQLEYYDSVMTYAAQYELPPSLVYGVIRTESGFDPSAHSSADARGLMQLTETALEWAQARLGEENTVTVDDLYDPDINIRYGCCVLSLLYELLEDEDAVIAAYNAGIGNVQSWLENPAYSEDGIRLHTIPFEETRHYVQRVRSAQAIYQSYYHIDDATA